VQRGSWLATLIGLLAATPSSAGNGTWHVTLNGDVAATDNVFAVARDNNPEADAFTQIRPGMLFAYDSPRFINELTAEVEFLEYALHSDRPSVTERLSWKAFVLPGPRSEMLLSANGSTGQLNALTSRSSPETTSPTVLPPSQAIDVYQADGTEYGSYISSKETRTSETGFARWTATDDQLAMPTKTMVFEAGGSLGFERTFRSNAISLEAGGSYLILDRDAPPGAMPGSLHQKQANPRGTAVWRHDYDKHWSSSLDGGAIYVHPLQGANRKSEPFPIFGAMVAFTDVWGRATLSVRRVVTPDLFIALNTVSDSAIVQFALPLPWLDDNPHARAPKLIGVASMGAERAQLVDSTTSETNGDVIVARVDAGVTWTPRPGQTWGLRYELVVQHGDTTGVIPTTSFFRNTLYLTFALRYPDRMAAQVPRRTQSVRADRKDLAPVGAEPVVPDPTEQLQEGDEEGGDQR
jgi:hypothetical protein